MHAPDDYYDLCFVFIYPDCFVVLLIFVQFCFVFVFTSRIRLLLLLLCYCGLSRTNEKHSKTAQTAIKEILRQTEQNKTQKWIKKKNNINEIPECIIIIKRKHTLTHTRSRSRTILFSFSFSSFIHFLIH